MPSIDKQQVKELLGNNLSITVVASAVGCTEGYITQLMSDEEFASEVAALKIVALQGASKRDASINSIEDRLIRKLSQAVDEGAFYKPRDLLSAFTVLNSAKRRGVEHKETTSLPTTVINLNIPAQIARRFVIDQQGEVLQVNDQTLVTMPTSQLLHDLQQKALAVDGKKYENVKNRLLSDLSELRERREENVSD
jgi:hypothetical protein